MHFHLPKSMHGWRHFAGEIAIIVIGVVIALAAEQAVQGWEWKQRTAAAIEDMRIEYSGDNGPQASVRVAIHDCLDRRYVTLRDAIVARNGPATRLALGHVNFPGRSYDQQSFEGAIAGGVVPHMSVAKWQSLRLVFAAIPNLNERAQAERMLLGELRAIYPVADELDGNARMSALRSIEQLREINNRIQSSAFWMAQKAEDAGFPIDRSAMRTEVLNYGANWRQCIAETGRTISEASRIYSR